MSIRNFIFQKSFNFRQLSYLPLVSLVEMSLNEQNIFMIFKISRASPQAIAAILGNWSVESSINPKRAEGIIYLLQLALPIPHGMMKPG